MGKLRRQVVLAAVIGSLSSSGCVLTSQQVEAVEKFSTATEHYGTLPGAALDAYASGYVLNRFVIRVPGQRLVVGEEGSGSVDNLPTLINQKLALAHEAERANRALVVLDRYAELLKTLTSDQFEKSLTTDASTLADELDSAITKYNEISGSSFPSLGSTAAGIVRGAFGIWIRVKQQQALKQLVPDADEIIRALTSDIAVAMDRLTAAPDGYLAGEQSNLRSAYADAANIQNQDKRGSLPIEYVRLYAAQMEQLETVRQLAVSAKTSAARYREAHQALVESIHQPTTVKTVLDQVKVLRVEIDEGRKLKKTLDEKK